MLTITIETANPTFRASDEDVGIELANALRRLTSDIVTIPNGIDLCPARTFPINDKAGNRIGFAVWQNDLGRHNEVTP